MQKLRLKSAARNAIFLGGMCALSYLAVYIARNMLTATTTQIREVGAFTDSQLGNMASIYFITYACGQLINGIVGDKVKAKYMISFGLILSGVCNAAFSLVAPRPLASMITYGCSGFFLSMIYGPITKVVAENTEPIYTTRCTLGYTFASFFGSPVAGLLASFLVWQNVFAASSTVLVVMAITSFLFFSFFERKKLIQYGLFKAQKSGSKNIGVLLKRKIVKFALIAIITGIVRTSVVFWLPTYMSQYLGLSAKLSATLFTVATLVISTTAFIAVFIYEHLGYRLEKTILYMFLSAALFFGLTFLVNIAAVNIIFLVLAIMSSNGAACLLWSRYCPSLRDTGMVSSATGFLDFLSYMAAAAANVIFANAATSIGWSSLILVWLGFAVFGIVISLPYDTIFKKMKQNDNT
jgi:sugar phosphate permease